MKEGGTDPDEPYVTHYKLSDDEIDHEYYYDEEDYYACYPDPESSF